MPVRKLREFLDSNGARYIVISHSPTYTAQEVAASVHIPGRELAKTVMVKTDGNMVMAVLPASYHVDLEMLRTETRSSKVELASEAEFSSLFPDCEVGAMPPFGNLYGVPVYVAEKLAEDEDIAFNAGTHHEVIRMGYGDFARLVQPHVLKFSVR